MKIEIDPHIVNTVRSVMLHHIGGANRIAYDELTEFIYGKATENNRRKLRAVISSINSDATNNVVICSDRTDGGLFMNGSDSGDIERHLQFIGEEESQAHNTLVKVTAMRHKLARLYPDAVAVTPQGQGRLW